MVPTMRPSGVDDHLGAGLLGRRAFGGDHGHQRRRLAVRLGAQRGLEDVLHRARITQSERLRLAPRRARHHAHVGGTSGGDRGAPPRGYGRPRPCSGTPPSGGPAQPCRIARGMGEAARRACPRRRDRRGPVRRAARRSPADARARRPAARPARRARPAPPAAWSSAARPARGRRAPSASGRGRRRPPPAPGRRAARSASTRSGATPSSLSAVRDVRGGWRGRGATSAPLTSPSGRPSASTSTGPVVAAGSVPMCVVVVTSTRRPAARASRGQPVDERRLAARPTTATTSPRPIPRPESRAGRVNGRRVLDHEQPALMSLATIRSPGKM